MFHTPAWHIFTYTALCTTSSSTKNLLDCFPSSGTEGLGCDFDRVIAQHDEGVSTALYAYCCIYLVGLCTSMPLFKYVRTQCDCKQASFCCFIFTSLSCLILVHSSTNTQPNVSPALVFTLHHFNTHKYVCTHIRTWSRPLAFWIWVTWPPSSFPNPF